MPIKGQKHSEESKRLIKEKRAEQPSPLIGRYGITEDDYNKARELGLEWCRDCKQFLPPHEFYKQAEYRKKGRGRRCIECNKKRVQDWRNRATPSKKKEMSERFKSWRAKNPTHSIDRRLSRYGVNKEWFDEKMEEQGNLCGICKATPEARTRMFCIDHNHSTDVTRGLLCHRCNIFVGMLEAGLLEAALAYLKKYE